MPRLTLSVISLITAVFITACGATSLPPAEPTAGSPCTAIGQSRTSPGDGATLLCVPAGEFLMGAAANDAEAQADEIPQHRVYLDAFWIDRTEVTNASFAKCMAAGACRPDVFEVSAQSYTPYAVHPAYRDYPVQIHEPEVAAAYCQWAGRRLPTEAEWEKAARGPDGQRYPWGHQLDCAHAAYTDCESTSAATPASSPCGYSAFCRNAPADSYPAGASPYGALNMAGNVWEWVADWYAPDYYAHSPGRNPTGPATGEFKARRGGGSRSLAADLRVTARASGMGHHYFDGQMGFRCAADDSVP